MPTATKQPKKAPAKKTPVKKPSAPRRTAKKAGGDYFQPSSYYNPDAKTNYSQSNNCSLGGCGSCAPLMSMKGGCGPAMCMRGGAPKRRRVRNVPCNCARGGGCACVTGKRL